MDELFDPAVKNFVIHYRSWEAYNAKSREEAIEMFRKDGHKDDEIIWGDD